MRHIDLCSHHNAAIRVVNYLLYLCTYLRSNERITTQDNNHRLEFEVPCHCTKYTSAFQPLVVICIFRTSFTTQPSTKPLIPTTTLPPPYHTHTHTHIRCDENIITIFRKCELMKQYEQIEWEKEY